jgi:hypothetical protein
MPPASQAVTSSSRPSGQLLKRDPGCDCSLTPVGPCEVSIVVGPACIWGTAGCHCIRTSYPPTTRWVADVRPRGGCQPPHKMRKRPVTIDLEPWPYPEGPRVLIEHPKPDAALGSRQRSGRQATRLGFAEAPTQRLIRPRAVRSTGSSPASPSRERTSSSACSNSKRRRAERWCADSGLATQAHRLSSRRRSQRRSRSVSCSTAARSFQ